MKTNIKKTTKAGKRSVRAKSPRFQPLFMPSNTMEAITEVEELDEMDPVFQAALDEYIFSLETSAQEYIDQLDIEESVIGKENQQLVLASNKTMEKKTPEMSGYSHYALQVLERHGKKNIGQRFYELCRNEASIAKHEKDLIPSEDNSQYYRNIVESPYSRELSRFAECYFKEQNCNMIKSKTILKDSIQLIIPNDINMWHFDLNVKDSEWLYKENQHQWSKSLPRRWTGQIANFYEPFVIRYKKCDSGRDITHMGLCPYCPVTLQDFAENFNRLFIPLRSRRYEAHLGTVHGVYSSGHEMPPPSLAEKKGILYASCMDCHQAKKLVNVSLHNPESLLLSYFKHGMKLHCKQRAPPQDPRATGYQSSHFSPPTSYY